MILTPAEVDRFFEAHYENPPEDVSILTKALINSVRCMEAAERVSIYHSLLTALGLAKGTGEAYLAGLSLGISLANWLHDIRELERIAHEGY